jgi:hypothetical protein
MIIVKKIKVTSTNIHGLNIGVRDILNTVASFVGVAIASSHTLLLLFFKKNN